MSETCRLHFDTSHTPQIPLRSGINWGNANAHVCTSDAYIPIRQNNLSEHSAMFPVVGHESNIINVIWDDGTQMCCSFEGTQDFNGQVYPKQISSYNDKSLLGSYLRGRLNVTADVIITLEDFNRYGRSHVDITKNDDGTFFFDFSVV